MASTRAQEKTIEMNKKLTEMCDERGTLAHELAKLKDMLLTEKDATRVCELRETMAELNEKRTMLWNRISDLKRDRNLRMATAGSAINRNRDRDNGAPVAVMSTALLGWKSPLRQPEITMVLEHGPCLAFERDCTCNTRTGFYFKAKIAKNADVDDKAGEWKPVFSFDPNFVICSGCKKTLNE
jgi:hypothetical protein